MDVYRLFHIFLKDFICLEKERESMRERRQREKQREEALNFKLAELTLP